VDVVIDEFDRVCVGFCAGLEDGADVGRGR